MKTKFTFFLFFILGLILVNKNLIAQQNNFIFDYDYAEFGYDSTSDYVEFYYSFDQNSLTRTNRDTGTFVEGVLHITLENSSSHKKVLDNDWKISYMVANDTSSSDRSLIGVVGFVIPAGEYNSIVSGRDAVDTTKGKSYKESISIKPMIKNNFAISDIEVSSKIIQDSPNEHSVFYKNTFEVIPIPTGLFGGQLPVVFYYCELYQLKSGDLNNPLKLTLNVFNSKGKNVYNKSKEISKKSNTRVEVGTVLVNKFPTDAYTMIISLIDTVKNTGINSSKRFYVYNPDIVSTDTSTGAHQDVLSSEFTVMSVDEIDLMFAESKYIATSQEIDQYKKISELEGKRKFMYEFWKKRDTDTSTPGNEYYNKYFQRVKESNQKFTSISRKGWKSDRGRVYILYGEPSEIERFPNQTDSKPYEIWHYNEIEGGVIFVFGDLTGFSDYTLLNSTKRGELRDDNWQNRLTSF